MTTHYSGYSVDQTTRRVLWNGIPCTITQGTETRPVYLPTCTKPTPAPFSANSYGAQGYNKKIFLSFYDPDQYWYLCWNGHEDHIDVSYGGIGESVIALIDIHRDVVDAYNSSHFEIFRHYVKSFLATRLYLTALEQIQVLSAPL